MTSVRLNSGINYRHICRKEVDMSEDVNRDCAVHDVTLATEDCSHVGHLDDERIFMSEKSWRKITDELQRLRALEGSLEGG